MDRAEVRKEIEWLMGSIRRGFEQRRGTSIFIAVVSFIIFAGGLGMYLWSNPNHYADVMDPEDLSMFITFGFIFFVMSILDIICGKIISPVEDHHKLLGVLRTFNRIGWTFLILVSSALVIYFIVIKYYRGIYWMIIFAISFMSQPKYSYFDYDSYAVVDEEIEQLKEFDYNPVYPK